MFCRCGKSFSLSCANVALFIAFVLLRPEPDTGGVPLSPVEISLLPGSDPLEQEIHIR